MIISRTKIAFEEKLKTLFLVSRVLSFRHTKQTSKNVVGTTFKHSETKVSFSQNVSTSRNAQGAKSTSGGSRLKYFNETTVSFNPKQKLDLF